MGWEESWDTFKHMCPEVQKYGEKIGRRLVELDESYPGESAAWRAENAYKVILEHFDGDVPDWIQNDFVKGLNFSKDYILENLQTHNWSGMWADIKKRFQDGYMEDRSTGEKGYLVWYMNRDTFEQLKDEKSEERQDFEKILDFYGYFLTSLKAGWLGDRAVIEPVYPESAYDFVHDTCEGIGYTFVPKENAARVDKSGLRCKSGNEVELQRAKEDAKARGEDPDKVKQYRYFPKRIYFAAFDPDDDWEERMKEVVDETGRDWDDVDVYRIDFNRLRCPIYQDPAMHSNKAFFTYHNIPLQLLKKVHEGSNSQG